MSCNHDCNNCQKKCEIQYFNLNEVSKIKKVIGVLSGKGGVGKSSVTTLLAINMAKKGYKVGILDADITGPSIPMAFNLENATINKTTITPAVSKKYNIKVVSVNLFLENKNEPVLWRGPVITSCIKQFYSDTNWFELDYLFIDMPPGTSDTSLTIFQNIKLDGVIIVSTPQKLVKMMVNKALLMAKKLNIKVLGIVQNMSYIKCSKCNHKEMIYGESNLADLEKEFDTKVILNLPLDYKLTDAFDNGKIEDYNFDFDINL